MPLFGQTGCTPNCVRHTALISASAKAWNPKILGHPALQLHKRQRMSFATRKEGITQNLYYRWSIPRSQDSSRQEVHFNAADLHWVGTRVDVKSSRSNVLMMRTTLTLDDDVAAMLERLRRSRRISLKRLINEALRRGLNDMGRPRRPREKIRTRAVALGRVRIASVDNIGALVIAD
jgi:hypothetical protein